VTYVLPCSIFANRAVLSLSLSLSHTECYPHETINVTSLSLHSAPLQQVPRSSQPISGDLQTAVCCTYNVKCYTVYRSPNKRNYTKPRTSRIVCIRTATMLALSHY